MALRTIFSYDKETGRFGAKLTLDDTHRLPSNLAETFIAPDMVRIQEGHDIAYFRNGKWEYETNEDVADDQEIG